MKTAFFSSIVLLLCGCSSQYQISQNAIALQKTLSREDAITQLTPLLTPSQNHAGLCAFIRYNRSGVPQSLDPEIMFDEVQPTKPLKVNGTVLSFMGTYKVAGSSSYSGNVKTTKYEITDKETHLDLNHINAINIQTSQNNDSGCKLTPIKAGYLVVVKSAIDLEVSLSYVNIAVNEIDQFIAALRVLHPEIKITEGMGF